MRIKGQGVDFQDAGAAGANGLVIDGEGGGGDQLRFDNFGTGFFAFAGFSFFSEICRLKNAKKR